MKLLKRFLLILLIVAVLAFTLLCVSTVFIMHSQFPRYDYPDRRFYTYYRYDPDFIDSYPRENVQFTSGENLLQGYIYGADNPDPKGLLVFAHGLTTAHEGYIDQLIWFVDQGWQVFAYDATGSGTSEGSGTVGLVQSALDLDAALTFAESDDRLNALPVCLLGHSWGGYAVTAVLNFDHDITAACSLSGYAYPIEMLDVGAEFTVGKPLAGVFHPFAAGYNRIVFGDNAGLNAVDGINKSGIPVLVMHGEHDDFVVYDRVSILSKQAQITNPRAEFVTLTGEYATHNDFFNSDASNEYIKAWNEQSNELAEQYGGKIPDDVRESLYSQVDRTIVNDINKALLEEIDDFYTGAIFK